MKIITQERSEIFETFEYEIPDDFSFPLDSFLKEMDAEQKMAFLERNDFSCERIGWEYSSHSVLDSVDVIV